MTGGVDVQAFFAGPRTLGVISTEKGVVLAEKSDDLWTARLIWLTEADVVLHARDDENAREIVNVMHAALDASLALRVRIDEAVASLRRPSA